MRKSKYNDNVHQKKHHIEHTGKKKIHQFVKTSKNNKERGGCTDHAGHNLSLTLSFGRFTQSIPFGIYYLVMPLIRFLNLSTRPPASTSFCLPVKNG